jgi:CheY-like chemotaxis protein
VTAVPSATGGPSPHTPRRLEALRVLIVEDHHDSADMLAEILGFDGAETQAAYLAEAGLEFFLRFRPDVVLVDLHLAGRHDGFWLVEQIRAEPPPLGTIPVLAVTGDTFLTPAQMQGFSAVIIKPVDTEALSRLLTRYVR